MVIPCSPAILGTKSKFGRNPDRAYARPEGEVGVRVAARCSVDATGRPAIVNVTLTTGVRNPRNPIRE